MTTNWERLWLNELELEGGIWDEFKLWMEEVKAEGDSLTEKAEKWDKFREFWELKEFTVAPADMIQTMFDKLEAIKTVVEHNPVQKIYYRLSHVSKDYDDLINDIKKILEGQDA